jgi:hypothetical protein
MPLDPISWILIIAVASASGAAGATVVVFWNEIKAWATSTALQILDQIDRAIETTSDAITYLVKEGKSYFKEVLIYTRNRLNNQAYSHMIRKPISVLEVPEEVRNQLGFTNVESIRVKVLRKS